MSNSQSLVPSLELCKKIPAGEFAESAFIYGQYFRQLSPAVIRRFSSRCQIVYAPAPTLQEIMAEIPFAQVSIFDNGSFVIHPRFGKKRNVRFYDDNATTAAMKVWLKLKGIEND